MSLFICLDCDMVANTARSRYWTHLKFICGNCDPKYTGRKSPLLNSGDGMFISAEGFLYGREPTHVAIIGVVPPRRPKFVPEEKPIL